MVRNVSEAVDRSPFGTPLRAAGREPCASLTLSWLYGRAYLRQSMDYCSTAVDWPLPSPNRQTGKHAEKDSKSRRIRVSAGPGAADAVQLTTRSNCLTDSRFTVCAPAR
jgi:hypothetical protein